MSSRKSIAGMYSSKGTPLMSLSSWLNQHHRYINLYSNIRVNHVIYIYKLHSLWRDRKTPQETTENTAPTQDSTQAL